MLSRVCGVLFSVLLWPGVVAAVGSAPSPYPMQISGSVARVVSELVLQKSQPLRQEQAAGRQGRRVAGEKAPSRLHAIVMMCDFSDSLLLGHHGQLPGSFPPPQQSDRYYAAHDSLFFDHMLSKVSDYYATVSGGRLDIQYSVHGRVVNLPHPMSYYGNHPEFGEQAVLLAAEVVDSLGSEIDFSNFDTFILVHAGAGEETDILSNSPEQIFSTYLNPEDFVGAYEDSVISHPYLMASGFPMGTGIDRVLILPETEQQDPIGGFGGGFGSLGVYCFEFGLHLGMLSLTDFTPSGHPDSQGIGQYGLMGFGLFVGLGFIPPHPCAYNKLLMGWLDPYTVDSMAPNRLRLTPAERPNDLWACARVDATGQEFWLLEYRLQDPNGDRRYSFGDDKNGNGLPDFYDMDSTAGDGTPTGKFDAATDSLERVVDAEWDFAMSENSARSFGELGWGSGVYVWHIDEGVIRDVFDAPRNLFNADAAHKAVDLEEADGIQDLDSSQPSPFMLGGDADSFRGESGRELIPQSRPSTATNAGAFTGYSFVDFSPVVLDSFARPLFVGAQNDTIWALGYADTMRFELSRQWGLGNAPRVYVQRQLPAGTDVRGSHLLVGDLDLLGPTSEIILAGHSGEVYALDGDLNEVVDRDGDPQTLEPLARGTWAGAPVDWHLPPALGDIDGDHQPEIVLTTSDGIYAFEADGSAVTLSDPASLGFYAAVAACRLPVVLVPLAGGTVAADETVAVAALVVAEPPSGAELGFVSGAGVVAATWVPVGPGRVPTPPAVVGDFIVVAASDSVSGVSGVHVFERLGPPQMVSGNRLFLPLHNPPGPLPILVGITPDSDPQAPVYYVSVVDTAGRGETVFFDGQMRPVRDGHLWPAEMVLTAPLGLGSAFVGEDVLGRVGHGGDWLPGWPQRPQVGHLLGMPQAHGEPLVARLLGAGVLRDQFIFPTRDGRLVARGSRGETVPGWPLAGPAATAGAAALGQLGGGPESDLVAVGTFDRIGGTTPDGGLAGEPVTTLTVWRDVAAAHPVWPMAGGSIWRNGSYDLTAWHTGTPAATGTGLVSGSHYCSPSPLSTGPLLVSGQVRSPARGKVFIYDLSGELVEESSWQDLVPVDPFFIQVPLRRAVTGLYLCRLVVDTAGAGVDESVISIAIVR